MKLFTDPRIELVGRPHMDVVGVAKFLYEHELEWLELEKKLWSDDGLDGSDAEWLIEEAGRGCYMSWPKAGEEPKGRSHEDHVTHLIEVMHGSVLEHVNFNFHVWGISRSCSHEIVRHRAGFAYSQLSQRYVDSSDCAFVVPPAIQELKKTHPETYSMWLKSCEESQRLYEQLTSTLAEMYQDIKSKTERRKKARQAARSVLPNATETKIFITCNGRALRHFCEMRANPAADLEIRKLAVAMFDIMSEKFPLIVHGMKKVELEDGTFGVESEFRKV